MLTETKLAPPSDSHRTLGQIALALHKSRTNVLSVLLSEEEAERLTVEIDLARYSIVEKTLTFASLAIRNQVVAVEVWSNDKICDAGTLYEAAVGLYLDDLSQDDLAAVRLVMLASATRDVVSDAAAVLKTLRNRRYGVESILAGVIQELSEVRLDSLRDLGTQFVPAEALCATIFFPNLVGLLTRNAELRSEVLAVGDQHLSDDLVGLYRAALLSLRITDLDGAISHYQVGACSAEPARRASSIWALILLFGQVELTQSQCDIVATTIEPYLRDRASELHTQACQVVVSALPSVRLAQGIWDDLIQEGDESALDSLATALPAIYRRSNNHAEFLRILETTLPIGPLRKLPLRSIDHVLRIMMDAESIDDSLTWITKWVHRHGTGGYNDSDFLDIFVQTDQWLIKNPRALSSLITRWMLDDERILPAAAGGMLSHAALYDASLSEFDLSIVDTLDKSGLVFLCRRVLGFVFNEKQALSLVLSLLKAEDAATRTHGLIFELLTQELGYDYPTLTLERLSTLKAEAVEPAELTLVEHAMQKIEATEAAFVALPDAKEFYPPTRLRRAFARAREKDMALKMREVESKSIFSQIGSRIPIKGGIGLIRYQNSSYGGVAPMASLRTSAVMPRRDVLDPVGQAAKRHSLQRAKRGDQ